MSGELPAGVRLARLDMHPDHRGAITELFRDGWQTGLVPRQWSAMVSRASVLRGVHLHLRNVDYFSIVLGRAGIGLRDIRRGSPTEGMSVLLEMGAEEMSTLTVPPGVLHGMHFPEPSVAVVAKSEFYDPADDLGCHWADPELRIPWNADSPVLSLRDLEAGSLSALLAAIEPHQPIGAEARQQAPATAGSEGATSG